MQHGKVLLLAAQMQPSRRDRGLFCQEFDLSKEAPLLKPLFDIFRNNFLQKKTIVFMTKSIYYVHISIDLIDYTLFHKWLSALSVISDQPTD